MFSGNWLKVVRLAPFKSIQKGGQSVSKKIGALNLISCALLTGGGGRGGGWRRIISSSGGAAGRLINHPNSMNFCNKKPSPIKLPFMMWFTTWYEHAPVWWYFTVWILYHQVDGQSVHSNRDIWFHAGVSLKQSNYLQTELLNTAHLAVWLQTPPSSPSRLLWTPWFWRRLIIYYIVLKREIAVGGLIIISRNKTKSISNCRDGDQDGNDSAVRRDHLEGERGLSEGGAGHSQAHWLRWLVQRWVGELILF